MKKLIVQDKFVLKGRGQVFIISMNQNELEYINVGDKFEVDGQVWSVKSIGGVRTTDISDLTIISLLVTPIDAQV